MIKKAFTSLLVMVIVALSCSSAQATVVTIATFADPAVNKNTQLFTVNLGTDLITGGWGDAQTGLTLQIPYSVNTYIDAFFTMTNVAYSGGITGGSTGGGTIKFFANGQSTSTTPLLQIEFDAGHVTPFGFGAMDMFYFDDVIITGSEITGPLTDESFAFSLGNLSPLGGNWNNGYTATAAFTSSAVPEPATIILLGTAGIWVFTRKKRSA
ncbi:MAG: PEP-CTERM sorting domain-containing protein [Phycisphaerae bacterium]|jgi:hypothetical protein